MVKAWAGSGEPAAGGVVGGGRLVWSWGGMCVSGPQTDFQDLKQQVYGLTAGEGAHGDDCQGLCCPWLDVVPTL